MAHGTTLAPFYRGWEGYEARLTEAIAPLSREQLALRAAPSLRPVWELAAHIAASRAYWFGQVLGEGQGSLEPMINWDDEGAPRRGAEELAIGLDATWQVIASCLERWGPATLADPFVTENGYACTRQWVIWHVIEHDLHHGGELFFTLGMHGLPTPEM